MPASNGVESADFSRILSTSKNNTQQELRHTRHAFEAPRISLRRKTTTQMQMKQTPNGAKTNLPKNYSNVDKEMQSEVFVYGPPAIQWVQNMREQMKVTKSKTAGFDHSNSSIPRRD